MDRSKHRGKKKKEEAQDFMELGRLAAVRELGCDIYEADTGTLLVWPTAEEKEPAREPLAKERNG